MLNRRQMLKWLTATGLACSTGVRAEQSPVRIGITPVFLTELTSVLRDWRDYLEQHLNRPVRFEQSNTYRDIVNNLLAQRLDFAWICGFPYIVNRSQLQLTAVPNYKGKPLYQSYLIVRVNDDKTKSLLDLRDKLFCYTDPDSNSGYLFPQYELLRQGLDPDEFFRKTFFTNGHRNAIEAVSVGLADGAHVDGYIWDTVERFNPEITRSTRVVTRSKQFGFPPFVAGPSVTLAQNQRMREVLIGMSDNPVSMRLLDRLNLFGFTRGSVENYMEIEEMARYVEKVAHVS
jgi:phosphonate transport system substrate-binding protein